MTHDSQGSQRSLASFGAWLSLAIDGSTIAAMPATSTTTVRELRIARFMVSKPRFELAPSRTPNANSVDRSARYGLPATSRLRTLLALAAFALLALAATEFANTLDRDRLLDALEAAAAEAASSRTRPRKRFLQSRRDEHGAGARDIAEAAGEVDRRSVDVARCGRAPRRRRGRPRVAGSRRPPARLRRPARARCRSDRRGSGARQHHRVADRLDQSHRRLDQLDRDRAEALGDRAELIGRNLFAERGEADEVGEADRDLARVGEEIDRRLVAEDVAAQLRRAGAG